MGIFGSIGRFVGGAAKKVGKIASPVVRTALSFGRGIPVVGGAINVVDRVKSQLFPRTGRQLDQVSNQARFGRFGTLARRTSQTGSSGDLGTAFAELFNSVKSRVDSLRGAIDAPTRQQSNAKQKLSAQTPLLVLGGLGLVGVLIVMRGGRG